MSRKLRRYVKKQNVLDKQKNLTGTTVEKLSKSSQLPPTHVFRESTTNEARENFEIFNLTPLKRTRRIAFQNDDDSVCTKNSVPKKKKKLNQFFSMEMDPLSEYLCSSSKKNVQDSEDFSSQKENYEVDNYEQDHSHIPPVEPQIHEEKTIFHVEPEKLNQQDDPDDPIIEVIEDPKITEFPEPYEDPIVTLPSLPKSDNSQLLLENSHISTDSLEDFTPHVITKRTSNTIDFQKKKMRGNNGELIAIIPRPKLNGKDVRILQSPLYDKPVVQELNLQKRKKTRIRKQKKYVTLSTAIGEKRSRRLSQKNKIDYSQFVNGHRVLKHGKNRVVKKIPTFKKKKKRKKKTKKKISNNQIPNNKIPDISQAMNISPTVDKDKIMVDKEDSVEENQFELSEEQLFETEDLIDIRYNDLEVEDLMDDNIKSRTGEHDCGRRKPCQHCGVDKWANETEFCCGKGKYVHANIPEISKSLEKIYKEKQFSRMSMIINNALSFTAIGTCKNYTDGFKDMGIPSFYKVQGKIYHRLLPVDDPTTAGHWYVVDASKLGENAKNPKKPYLDNTVLADYCRRIYKELKELENPLLKQYEIMSQLDAKDLDLELRFKCNSNEIAAVFTSPEGINGAPKRRAIAVKKQVQNDKMLDDGKESPGEYTLRFVDEGDFSDLENLDTSSQNTVTIPRRVVKDVKDIQFVDITSNFYDILQYPLIYPKGGKGDGQSNETKEWPKSTTGKDMTFLKSARQMILRSPALQYGGRLMNQYVLDTYNKVQEHDLNYLRSNNFQKKYKRRIFTRKDFNAEQREKLQSRIFMPGKKVGSPKYQQILINDGFYIASNLGKATYFITFTCNPNWKEITDYLKPNQKACDNPVLVARVFKLKYDALKKQLRGGKIFDSKSKYLLSVVEWQQRGLPHAHIALKLEDNEPITPEEIDKYICAELPTDDDPLLKQLVEKHMTHKCKAGRCCPKDDIYLRNCFRRFPKKILQKTMFDTRNYPHYRRRTEKDRYVVPYNAKLLKMFNCHINVELSHTVNLINYLYKYIFKGPDTTYMKIRKKLKKKNNGVINEIDEYLYSRWLGACEASWRLLGYHINCRDVSVKTIPVHFEDEDVLFFQEDDDIEDVCSKVVSLIKRYFFRPTNTRFENLTIIQYYNNYVIDNKERKYQDSRRVKKFWKDSLPDNQAFVYERTGKTTLFKLWETNVKSGKRHWLRKLLKNVHARSYNDLKRDINDPTKQYSSYREACEARGLLSDPRTDAEDTLNELIFHDGKVAAYKPSKLRFVFVTLLQSGADPKLLDKFSYYLGRDFDDNIRRNKNNPTLIANARVDKKELSSIAMKLLKKDLNRRLNDLGFCLRDYGIELEDIPDNETRAELQKHDKQLNKDYFNQNYPLLNKDQKVAFKSIMKCYNDYSKNGFTKQGVFVDGPAGRGKTFLFKVVEAKLRSEEKIVLPIAFTGIAALDHFGGRTSHNLFKFPLIMGDHVVCNIKKNTQRAELLNNASMIIWDELPMVNRKLLIAVDLLLRDIAKDPSKKDLPFGGKLLVGGGDFRQLLPVIKNCTQAQLLASSVKKNNCTLWKYFVSHSLTIPQRDKDDVHYQKELNDIGNGEKLDVVNPEETTYKKIALSSRIKEVNNDNSAIKWVYPNLENPDECCKSAILCYKHVNVNHFNNKIFEQLKGEKKEYTAYEIPSSEENPNGITPNEDLLASVQENNTPNHLITFKPNMVVMCCRNLSVEDGIMNGSRLIITKLGKNIITVRKPNESETHFIPRINFQMNINGLPFLRRQFPLKEAYSYSVHKSQGKTLQKIVLNLRDGTAFSHGMLYVAMSRVGSFERLRILVDENTERTALGQIITNNFVFKTLLTTLPKKDTDIDMDQNIIEDVEMT